MVMDYTVDDYNVTIKRGFVHPETGEKLWGIRRYDGKEVLDWRTPEAFEQSAQKKYAASKAMRLKHKAKLKEMKLERGCEICGFGRHKFPKKYREQIAIILEFDHIDPKTKSHNICDIGHGSWQVIEEELSKCRVLCKPCHVNTTARQRQTRGKGS